MTQAGYFDWDTCSSNAEKLNEASAHYEKNGFVVFTSFATPTETESLRSQGSKIMDDFHHPKSKKASSTTVFTTRDEDEKMDTDYFLRSASKISCFLEVHQDEAKKLPTINKIAHALHDLDPVFDEFSHQPKVREAAAALGVKDQLIAQSMYILKNKRVGDEVRPHRDRNFVRPKEGIVTAMWWALHDADEENACLWAVPGSHKDGRATKHFGLDDSLEETVYGGNMEADVYDPKEFVSLPAKTGDLVVINGGVVHKSEINRSERDRHAYAIALVPGEMEEKCWLQRPEDFPFRAL